MCQDSSDDAQGRQPSPFPQFGRAVMTGSSVSGETPMTDTALEQRTVRPVQLPAATRSAQTRKGRNRPSRPAEPPGENPPNEKIGQTPVQTPSLIQSPSQTYHETNRVGWGLPYRFASAKMGLISTPSQVLLKLGGLWILGLNMGSI